MYLHERKREYIYSPEKTVMAESLLKELFDEDQTLPPLGKLSHVTVDYEVGYWRKANHIHGWFVKNVQDGEDNCEEYPVSMEQLSELRRVCEEVLEKPGLAIDLLPRTSGFFFGDDGYGESYLNDCQLTIDIIKELEVRYVQDRLADQDWDREFYYSASW
jgi:hypothetical protein